jgi:hypothetical protein
LSTRIIKYAVPIETMTLVARNAIQRAGVNAEDDADILAIIG